MTNPQRVYIEVRVSFSADGTMTPALIKWNDGRVFDIDRVLDVRRAASDAGSMGLRYTVKIMGQVRRLFFEDAWSDTGRPRWFVESGRDAECGSTKAQIPGSAPEPARINANT